MLTVEMLDQALAALEQLRIKARFEWLDGRGGGPCEFGGRKWLFLDLAQTPGEHLDQALACLALQPEYAGLNLPADLTRIVHLRKSA